jgi:SAM-dependent methyltransferase
MFRDSDFGFYFNLYKRNRKFSRVAFWYPGKRKPDSIIKTMFILDSVEKIAPPGTRILNVGCGHGALDQYLQSRGYLVTGIDIVEGIYLSKKSLKDWIFRIIRIFLNIHKFTFIRADALNYMKQIDSCSIDVVLDGCAVHEFNTTPEGPVTKGFNTFYSESFRVLKEGGFLIQATDVLLDQDVNFRNLGFCKEGELLEAASFVGFRHEFSTDSYSVETPFKVLGELGIMGLVSRKLQTNGVSKN